MKKLLLIITAFIFVACSDDGNDTLISDDVVGTWHCYKNIITTPDGVIEQSINDGCPVDMPTIKFNSNSTGSIYLNDGNCTITGQESFEWETLGEGNYTISTPEVDRLYTISFDGNEMEVVIENNTDLKGYFYKVE